MCNNITERSNSCWNRIDDHERLSDFANAISNRK